MAWVAPTKHLKNKDTLDEKRFYRLISQESNFIDPDMAFLFYMAMVSVVGQELRNNKMVRLPHLGDLALVQQKPRVAWMGRIQALISAREVLRFYPKEHLKRYFAKRQGAPRYSEVLPPTAIH